MDHQGTLWLIEFAADSIKAFSLIQLPFQSVDRGSGRVREASSLPQGDQRADK